jgi:hypothetical protein
MHQSCFMDFDQVLQRLDWFLGANPVFASDVYVAPNATVLGKVSIGSGSSVMAAQAAPQARQRETYTAEHRPRLRRWMSIAGKS